MVKKHRSKLGDRIHSTLEANTEGSRKEQEEKKVDYMKTIINASKIIYMWPVEDKTFSKSIGHHLGAWMVFVYCLLFLASFFLQIVFHFQDVAGQAQTIDFTTVIISGAFRYAYIYFRSEKYLKLARMIRNGFIHRPFFSTNDEITLHKYYKNGLKIICFYSALVISWIIQVLTLPIVKYVSAMSGSTDGNEMNATELTLLIPIDAYFPFNHDTLPVVVGLYIFQLFGFFFYMLIYLLVDNFWYLVIMLTIGQFALLKVSFESITKDLDDLECTAEAESITLETQALEFGEKLKKCISHHTFLRE